ncbi:hypothetical protein COOONC_07261 [Cooperia oncophora]
MHWLLCLMSLLLVGDVVLPARRRHTLNMAMLETPVKGREVVAYASADQHPRTSDDDDQTEFVRREWTEAVYKKVRTYSWMFALFYRIRFSPLIPMSPSPASSSPIVFLRS